MNNDWQAKKNAAERDWLIEKHKPIVFHLAKKIRNSLPFQTEMEDLVAYGQLGLVEASERFDPSRGNSFATFAHYRIKGAIYDGLREMGAITRSRPVRFVANANDVLMTEVDDSVTGTAATVRSCCPGRPVTPRTANGGAERPTSTSAIWTTAATRWSQRCG